MDDEKSGKITCFLVQTKKLEKKWKLQTSINSKEKCKNLFLSKREKPTKPFAANLWPVAPSSLPKSPLWAPRHHVPSTNEPALLVWHFPPGRKDVTKNPKKIFKQVWWEVSFSVVCWFRAVLGRLCWKSQLKRAVVATNKMSSFHQNISAKRHCSFNNKFYRIVCPAISEVLRGPISPPFQTLQDFWPRL